jgi:hypothetical protein
MRSQLTAVCERRTPTCSASLAAPVESVSHHDQAAPTRRTIKARHQLRPQHPSAVFGHVPSSYALSARPHRRITRARKVNFCGEDKHGTRAMFQQHLEPLGVDTPLNHDLGFRRHHGISRCRDRGRGGMATVVFAGSVPPTMRRFPPRRLSSRAWSCRASASGRPGSGPRPSCGACRPARRRPRRSTGRRNRPCRLRSGAPN